VNDLKELKVDEVAFVDKGAGKGVTITLFKRFQKTEETQKMKNLDDLLAEMSEEDAALVMQAIEEAKHVGEGEEEEATEDAAEKQEEEEEKEEEEDGEVAKVLQKRFRVMKTENAQLQKRLQKMEIAQEREAFAKRAECFPNVPTFNAEDLGEFLMQINKCLPAEMAEKTEQMIKSVNEICGDSAILTEFGKSGAGTTGNGGAMKTAEAMAKNLMTEDSSLTKAVALNKVWEQNINLRNQYRVERRGNK
jgi:hypothetical protein